MAESNSNDTFGAWLTGFSDGESHFAIGRDSRTGTMRCTFIICLREDDKPILETIMRFWGCGKIYRRTVIMKGGRPQASYEVSKIRDLANTVVPHFDKFPLRTKKARDFVFWKEAVLLLNSIHRRRQKGQKKKYTTEEIARYVALKNAITQQRKFESVEVIPVPKPVLLPTLFDP